MEKIQKPKKVYLFGGEGTGWALDADVETTRKSLLAIPDLVTLVPLAEAEVVHSVWDYPLMHMDPALLDKKRIICHICNDLVRTLEDPCMVPAVETIGLWVAISRIAESEIRRLGYQVAYIPYSVDRELFTPPELFDPERKEQLINDLGLPKDSFIISNFMRDSSGSFLDRPKEQKGVEQFVAIVRELRQRGRQFHLLLAGPRRHWLRNQLKKHKIPYTYVGKEMDDDDNDINILSPSKINELYHLSDLHLVTSRWEGGPRSVLESAATRTPMLCTPVGMAPDILHQDNLIDDLDVAVARIEQLMGNGPDSGQIQAQYETIQGGHTPEANSSRFADLYRDIEQIPVFRKSQIRWGREKKNVVPTELPVARKVVNYLRGRWHKCGEDSLTISLWHEYHKPPYGGGNQFMMALRRALEKKGVDVRVNRMASDVDVHICNSAWFDAKKFEKQGRAGKIRMIHRIGGPVTLYRGEGRNEDDRIFELNHQFAAATVFQSAFSLFASSELGYQAVSPTVIHNSVDDNIFNREGRKAFHLDRKIKLISSAWSDNPNKGGPFYKWLDQNLDFDCYEYTFVGRVQQSFDNICHIPPQDSDSLAKILREHDIYISASFNEPCSNALLEALSCGLPSLYRNEGGNRELVGFGGLAFDGKEDFRAKLERIVACYEQFQSVIFIQSIEEIAARYLALAKRVVEYHIG